MTDLIIHRLALTLQMASCILYLSSCTVISGAGLQSTEEKLEKLDNGTAQIGIDLNRGGAITYLSWKTYSGNAVNIHDPGRLIQQSYYAGKNLDRIKEGQHKAWSPWEWNPIQGGGVGSWAVIKDFKRTVSALTCTTIPKLWDMANEEAEALMYQQTAFERGMPDVLVVKCRIQCLRTPSDKWGPASVRNQELPAFYFTRNFDTCKTYQGNGKWLLEKAKAGPPWTKTTPRHNVMAVFNKTGQGIGVYSPSADRHWNFGPHGGGDSSNPKAGPCMHLAPVGNVRMGPTSDFSYRYWIITGTERSIATTADTLLKKYANSVHSKHASGNKKN